MQSEYWQRRKDNKRGQGDYPQPIFYPKSQDVPNEEIPLKDGTTKEIMFPNDIGSHFVRVPGKGLQYLNRTEYRRKAKDRSASASNYKHQHEKNGFSHAVNQPDHKPLYPPSLTNHIRHRERQVAKEIEAKS